MHIEVEARASRKNAVRLKFAARASPRTGPSYNFPGFGNTVFLYSLIALSPGDFGMPSKRERGKISRENWEAIASRYRGGETFASIARSFGCTPPAIRYIVTRTLQETASENAGDEPGRNPPVAPSPVALEAGRRSEAGAGPSARGRGIDASLRQRVNSDIAAFLVAFDAVSDSNTSETRRFLLEATDRLLRAGARTRLAIEEPDDSLISGAAAVNEQRAIAVSGRRN